MPKTLEEISNIPHADASNREIEELISKLKTFKEDEFADLLHQRHNIIRNREKLDPAAAFDEIAKILLVKVYVERELRAKRQRKNLFNVEFLDEQIGKHPLNTLFEKTKEEYEEDKIFEDDEEIRLKPATGREIVKLSPKTRTSSNMGRSTHYLTFEGQLESSVLGAFRIIRGFASLQDLAKISVPYEMEDDGNGAEVKGQQREPHAGAGKGRFHKTAVALMTA